VQFMYSICLTIGSLITLFRSALNDMVVSGDLEYGKAKILIENIEDDEKERCLKCRVGGCHIGK